MTRAYPHTEEQRSIEPFADEFGVGVGLEVSLKWIDNGALMAVTRVNGNAFESYVLTNVETALCAVAYLIRGSRPPRDLICRDTPAR